MKRGFSLIALAVIVIITLILATSVVIAATSTINNSKKLAFGTEIKLVQDSIYSYSARNDGQLPISQAIIFDYDSLRDETSKEQFTKNMETIEDGKIVLYEIDYEKCGISNLKYGNRVNGKNDVYSVSTKTGKVYYNMGLKIGNITYFTINDELLNILNLGWEKQANSGVIFEPSTTEWTRNNVDVTIKIPKKYIVVGNIVATDIGGGSYTYYKNDDLSSADKEFDIYQLNNQTITRNYTVKVTYKEASNMKEKSVEHSVRNIDITAPTVLSAFTTKTTNSIMVNASANDSESGISKYYFSKDGINYFESESNEFTFENLIENTSYNIYVKVEDKVGNISSPREQRNISTDSLGNISIRGQFSSSSNASTLVEIVFDQVTDTSRYYKIDDSEWISISGLTERLYIDQDCTIYARIIDKSGQIKEVSKRMQKIE